MFMIASTESRPLEAVPLPRVEHQLLVALNEDPDRPGGSKIPVVATDVSSAEPTMPASNLRDTNTPSRNFLQ
jgi:hypothetical protein